MVKRRRSTTAVNESSSVWLNRDGSVFSQSENRYVQSNNEVLVTTGGHPAPYNGIEDRGGSFIHYSSRLESNPSRVSATLPYRTGKPNPEWKINGAYSAHFGSFTGTTSFTEGILSESSLDALGTTCIARSIPTNPLSGVGQFLGELKSDGLPMKETLTNWKNLTRKHKTARQRASAASRQYLDLQFASLPFVADILDFASVVQNRSRLIQQYGSGSGKNQRRRYSLPNESMTVTADLGLTYPFPPLNSHVYGKPGRKLRTTTTTRSTWFSGCFTYFLPSGQSLSDRAKRFESYASKLFGTRLNATLLWQLAPWSWAIDWGSTVGDVIHNWDAFRNDGLIMRYGYIMSKYEIKTEWSLDGCTLRDGTPFPRSSDTTYYVIKQRRRATPYGFGLKFGDFSPKQWSVIAALGIVRGPLGSSYK